MINKQQFTVEPDFQEQERELGQDLGTTSGGLSRVCSFVAEGDS